MYRVTRIEVLDRTVQLYFKPRIGSNLMAFLKALS